MTRHLKSHDTSASVFSCDICSKAFIRKEYLEKHKKTHTSTIHVSNLLYALLYQKFFFLIVKCNSIDYFYVLQQIFIFVGM